MIRLDRSSIVFWAVILLVITLAIGGTNCTKRPIEVPLKVDQGEQMFGGALDNACYEAANASVVQWRAEGKTEQEIEALYQSALAECSGADGGVASLVGIVNVDYARLGRMLIAGELAPDEYLARVRDRSRKLRMARADPTWVSAFVQGDEDGDFVPDDRDRCPRTPDLIPTDDEGCPQDDRPDAPSEREVRRTIGALGVVISSNCDGAALPTVSNPIKAGYDNVDRSTFAIAVTKVNNQPDDCIVFYEISIRFSNESEHLIVPLKSLVTVIFRSTENTDHSPSGQLRQVFRTRETDTGQRKRLYDIARYYGLKEIRVRTVNGNGLSKGWSPPLSHAVVSFGEP